MFASTGATRLLPLLAAALAAAAMVWRHHGALVDEAFVALRAGLNLVAGHGLVLHPGDPAVVVAVPYSILAALAASLGVGGLPALRLASLLGLLLLLGAAAGIARTVGRELVLPVLLLLLPSYALAYWAIVPADPVWVATLIAGGAALFLLEIDGWRGSVLPFLLAAIISPATGIAYLVWRPLAGHGQPPGAALRDVAIFAVGFGAFLGWRWLAAGTPLLGEGDGGGAIAAGLLDLNRWIAAYPFVAGMLAWPVLRLRVRGAAPASLR
ncbi:MAG TPA: hypothetical protein VEB21_02840, partial [Terriglobales bacterium]|nr:hypothetical protein [Terriglobales bacterium]